MALSELAANAVAASAPRTCVSVRAQRKADSVVLEVENAPESDAAISLFYDNDDPVRGRGRGLTIVSAYTDLVEVILPHGEHGLVVRCRKQCTWSTGQPAR